MCALPQIMIRCPVPFLTSRELCAGPLVYANYGSPDDFATLEAMGVDVKNKIVITRYGRCFRGLKVQFWYSWHLIKGFRIRDVTNIARRTL